MNLLKNMDFKNLKIDAVLAKAHLTTQYYNSQINLEAIHKMN